MQIASIDQLRQSYAYPTERVLRKQITAIDPHCRHFIGLSPFLVLSTCDEQHRLDASPRGGDPGFVRVDAQGRLLIPDSPGNNRLDSLENIIRTGQVGLLFMIPGVDETLRVNGSAILSTAPEDIGQCTTERRTPKLLVKVTVRKPSCTAPRRSCAPGSGRTRRGSTAPRYRRSGR